MSAPLSPEDRLLLEELFERAASLPHAEHAAFLEHECPPANALHIELARLLAGLAGADFLGQAQDSTPSLAGSQIGPFELLEKIGEGGMGEVYLAEQSNPVQRRVALKVIKLGMDSVQVLARFEAERQALARMSHTNVAQVFDGGNATDGRPYFVMEYVPGEPIQDYCDRCRLSTRGRIQLFLAVCEGVQHAHQRGLIHRDLKPSNLLVMEQDGRALPKVIDFGIARATTGSLSEGSPHTMPGQVVGTLDYMSPEQADPTGEDIDTRSDIYSLGVVLYQLVSGLLPFDHSVASDRPLSELQRLIRERDPLAPSTRLRRQTNTSTAIAVKHGTDDRSLVRQLAGDLDWVTLKALEKDPARRYASVSELAQDLRRHLAHEPVLAGRPGALYRMGKFVRRNRVGVAAAVLASAGIFAGAYGIISGWLVARALQPQADEYNARVLLDQSAELWPPHPEMIPALETWLVAAREATAALDDYSARLGSLGEDVSMDHASRLDRSSHLLLGKLVSELSELGDDRRGLLAAEACVPEYGWSIPKRLRTAQAMQARFKAGGELARSWEAMVRDDEFKSKYPGLDLELLVGLEPLGPDPVSELWEFAHLPSGAAAVRGEDGRLVMEEATGLVLVLIPAGWFPMGAQGDTPGAHNYDSNAKPKDGPVHDVTVSAFFLSKYEMTQGQWRRLTGTDPSRFASTPEDPNWVGRLPVETVNQLDCTSVLERLDLVLPSEAQWEYACRARTTGPRPFADAHYMDHANIADLSCAAAGYRSMNPGSKGWDDTYAGTAPVGSLSPNAFGLHDMIGNVWEWCRDGFDQGFYERTLRVDPENPAVDPENPAADNPVGVGRGGSWWNRAGGASSALRAAPMRSSGGHLGGLRPAKEIPRAE